MQLVFVLEENGEVGFMALCQNAFYTADVTFGFRFLALLRTRILCHSARARVCL